MSHLFDDADPADPADPAQPAEPVEPVEPVDPAERLCPGCAAPLYRLEVVSARNGEARIARIAGDLDYSVTPALRRRLLDGLAGIEIFVLDLTGVSLLSAAAMEMLVDLHDLCDGHRVRLGIVAATRAVLRPLALTGLDQRLPLHPSQEAALKQT